MDYYNSDLRLVQALVGRFKSKLEVDEDVEKSELTEIMINIKLPTNSLLIRSARGVFMDIQSTQQLSQRYPHISRS